MYLQAITQFMVMCINQFRVDTTQSITTAKADLQAALDIAKDQITVQSHQASEPRLDLADVFKNVDAVTKVLGATVLSLEGR